MPDGMRLNKYISETGVCSRREADAWIEAGRVSVNGAKAELGTRVGERDTVTVDGRPIGAKRKPVYIALNKPVGITCTTERHVAGNIIDFLELLPAPCVAVVLQIGVVCGLCGVRGRGHVRPRSVGVLAGASI